MRSIPASELKANCRAVLDEIERTGEPVTILPAAVVPPGTGEKYPQMSLFGTVEILGDLIEPADS
jgi:hypothetical protein